MPGARRRRVGGAPVLLLALVLLLLADAARAEPPRVGVILSQLPAPGSAAYAEIRKQAGDARGQSLPLSKAEMWSMPAQRLAPLARTARAHGVTIALLGADWNEVIRPPPPGVQLTPEQQAVVARARASSGTIGVAVVVAPAPPMLEYALTHGTAGATAEQGTRIVVVLGQQLRLTLTRSSVEVRPDRCVWRGVAEDGALPATIMWWPGGRLAGIIRHHGRIFSIRHIGGPLHALIETSEDVLPQDHAPARPTPGNGEQPR